LYGVTTPIGIAAGLGIRTTYNPSTPTASIVSGTMDSLSAGILIYTGTVEVSFDHAFLQTWSINVVFQLLAHEFLFNPEMLKASNSHLAYAIGCMLTGCGIMALLGNWA
jgi:zinc transporter 1/2/3